VEPAVHEPEHFVRIERQDDLLTKCPKPVGGLVRARRANSDGSGELAQEAVLGGFDRSSLKQLPSAC
jgi:hypothetical protein